MNGLIQLTPKAALLFAVLLGGLIFTSCGSPPQPSSHALPEAQSPNESKSMSGSQSADSVAPRRTHPQLIKKAAITLIVDSIDKSINAVMQIINKQFGDLIGLEAQQPNSDATPATATIQFRIPQNQLEVTLDELTKLGIQKSRKITVEDVSDQLVDFQARLSNLRKTESNLQKIMDRADSVKDVLSVAQELSNVRQSIEQIDAQLKNVQNQVAYSTITLNLQAANSTSTPQQAIGTQIQETWNHSTRSFSQFSVALLKMGIWLMVYSPYLLILVAASYGFNRWRRRSE